VAESIRQQLLRTNSEYAHYVPANRQLPRVDLREQGGGDVDVRHAAHEGAGDPADRIHDHSAAEGHDHVTPRQAELGQPVDQLVGGVHALALFTCVDDPAAQQQPANDPPAGGANPANGAAAAQEPVTSETFVATATRGGSYEIAAGEIAQDRGQSDDVRAFGDMLVTDHTAAVHERAKNAGATIVREPNTTDYGSLDFTARDPEGNLWVFGTYRGEPRASR